jgi:hypothetical protein
MAIVGLVLTVLHLTSFQTLFGQYVPDGSPAYSYDWYGSGQSCEYLFLGTFRPIIPSPKRGTNMLLDRTGDLVWYHQGSQFTLDFKVHPNGRLTYSDRFRWYVLDSGFNVIDTVLCDGRVTDHHDMIITEDGHFYMICRDDSVMDVSSIRTRNGTIGSTQAQVRMVVIQELDNNGELVKEWNGFDTYVIYDSDTTFFTNPGLLDHSHTNSIDLDEQGNLLVSHRHLNEVTLIDWSTGQVKWQLGGKNNDFNQLGDPGFFGQHDARFLPGNQISVYDNGHEHHAGRGMLIEIDTVNWQAETIQTWEDNITSLSMGSFRTFQDGSALVGWGELNSGADPTVTYYNANGGKVLDVSLNSGYSSYRAQCFDLPFALHRPQILCSEQNGQAILSVSGTHDSFEWTHGDTLSSIVVGDTGRYQVFVPYGIGKISSPPLYVTDLQNACAALNGPSPIGGIVRPPKLIGQFDLLGNALTQPHAFQVFIERYSDGSCKKRVWVRRINS